MNFAKTRRALIFAAAALACSAPSFSQTFPSKPIRILVPFPAGGPSDNVSRLIGHRLSETLGQPVVVDNRPGGGGQIAASALLQAPADGYTLFVGDIGAMAINPYIYSKLSFNPLKDFQPLTTLMISSMAAIVPAASTATSINDLLRESRANKPVTFASQGIGTGGHILGELLAISGKTKLQHIPYKGSAAALQAVMAGEVDLLFDSVGAASPFASSGKVKIIALADTKRSPLAPNVATTTEQGLPDVKMFAWYALAVRSGTPDAIARRLNSEVVAALNNPDVQRKLKESGFEPAPSTIDEVVSLVKQENRRWEEVVRAAKINAD
ncbi:MAG: tripartite tricarboxylate transporter substrate binding protein [Pseudomonadota bacterium]